MEELKRERPFFGMIGGTVSLVLGLGIMKVYKIIHFGDGKELYFGTPTSQDELDKMFSLRYKVYVKEKKYITSSENADVDIDKHDKGGHCVYFIASVGNDVVGTARVIREDKTPTEADYFDFQKPKVLVGLESGKLVEIGRIISRPFQQAGVSVPRNLVTLGLIATMAEFGEKNGIVGGYGSMKMSAFKKFVHLGVPMHKIRGARLKFDSGRSNDPLDNFFNDKDPVIPLFFLMREIKQYVRIIFDHSGLFRPVDSVTYKFTSARFNLLNRVKLFLTLKFRSYIPSLR